ncbi:MAG: hypothetical protein OHK0028_16370 [Deltaproteobacteria bacterium]
MIFRVRTERGQSVVETALALPLLLALMAGGYWCYRNLSLSSSAESAAHAQMLRAGRRLAAIDRRLSATILPCDNAVRMEAHAEPLAGPVPFFGSLSGRTAAGVDVSLGKEPVGAFLDMPSHAVRKVAEGSVDCWDKGTSSASKVRRIVLGVVATGVIR